MLGHPIRHEQPLLYFWLTSAATIHRPRLLSGGVNEYLVTRTRVPLPRFHLRAASTLVAEHLFDWQ